MSFIQSPVLDEYDVENGLGGLERDVVQLILMENNVNQKNLSVLRNVLGLSQERFLQLKQNSRFRLFTPNVALCSALESYPCSPNPYVLFDGLVARVMRVNPEPLNDDDDFIPIYFVLNRIIDHGVFRLNIKQICAPNNIWSIGVHACGVSDLPFDFHSKSKWCENTNAGWSEQNGFADGNNRADDGDIVSAEVDTYKKTLHFFMNGDLQPVWFRNIPLPLRFHVSSFQIGDSFEIVSLQCFSHSSVTESTPVSPVHDPDNLGLVPRMVDWNYGPAKINR